MEKWKYKERHRKATEESDQILFRAIDEGRPMTEQEQNRRYDCMMTAIRAKVCSIGLDELARLKQEARRGPLHPAQFKLLKILAKRGFPEAQELLEKCLRSAMNSCNDNLPAISAVAAKSFRTA